MRVTCSHWGDRLSLFRNRRHALVALTVMVAFVAVVVPTCRMIGCSMEMSTATTHKMMDMGMGVGAAITNACGGTWSVVSGTVGVVPAGVESLLMSIAIALFAAIVLMHPQVDARPVIIRDASPPPPPEDPRGERLRL